MEKSEEKSPVFMCESSLPSVVIPSDSEVYEDEEMLRIAFNASGLQDMALQKGRGLSKYYSGRSKAFQNIIAEVKTVDDLAKQEHPFNILMRAVQRNEIKLPCKSSMVDLALGGDGEVDQENKQEGCDEKAHWQQHGRMEKN